MKSDQSGFTLIELIIAMTVAAIVLSIAIPSFQEMLANNRMKAGTRDLVAAIQLSKAEAVAQSVPVTLCKKNVTSTNCDNGAGWEDGWIAFADNDGNANVDAGDTLLLVHDSLPADFTIRGTGGAADSIIFRPSGITNLDTLETLVECDHRGFEKHARAIIISMIGRGSVLKANETTETNC